MRKAHAAGAVAAAAAVAGLGFCGDFGAGSEPSDPLPVAVGASAAASAGTPRGERTAAASPAPAPAPAPASEPAPPPLGSGEVPNLRSDAAGHLVVDSRTRDELERLLALNGAAESWSLLQKLSATLPPIAYREAVDAYHAYRNYQMALAQAYPAGQPLADENEALAQLDGLHALRIATLGPQVAAAYFGDEEAAARRLIAQMQAHPMPGATLEDKALRAQEALAGKP